MRYRYIKKAGALQEAAGDAEMAAYDHADEEAALTAEVAQVQSQILDLSRSSHRPALAVGASPLHAQAPTGRAQATPAPSERGAGGLDPTRANAGGGMFTRTIEDGQHVLMVERDGTMTEIAGPKRVWRIGRRFYPMPHYVAHPGEFLIVRHRSGAQEHLAGPVDVWFDRRKHVSMETEEALQIASKEAVVAYSKDADGAHSRRIVYGPATFVPEPGEWLHTFSWHGARGGDDGYKKVPNALVFQKLWMMPDQMYHDVEDVRTADDAVLTVRLMVFFELADIEKMLDTTHDPIGDFVNAASSDVVDFVGRHTFEQLKQHTDKLNELSTYKQLVGRAQQCGYRINKVVYRGYGLPPSLQEMHDQAIESRTRLQLEKDTERQAQELEDFKLDRGLARADKQRQEKASELSSEIALARERQQEELRADKARREFVRSQNEADAELQRSVTAAEHAALQKHFGALERLGVDLTRYLTQARADQVIELRGTSDGAHVHVSPAPHGLESGRSKAGGDSPPG
jgi:regulator of protease activity HflC (stomatin/prohibitin superfamily)